jgi:hypothetical protein
MPIRVRATQWADSPIFLPKKIRIAKETNGRNKFSNASRLRLDSKAIL